MPTRIIREGILTSERINKLTERAELFYRRLMSVVDDYGRFPANLMLLRASCYPLKLDSVKEDSIKKHLAEAEDAGLIVLYTVDSKPYLEIQDFGQRINAKPKYPGTDQQVTPTHGTSPGIPGNPRLGEGVVEDEGGDGMRKVTPAQLVLDSYHRLLPKCQSIAVLNDKRKRRIADAVKLAKDVCEQQGWPYEPKGFWDAYFGECAKDAWLCGDKPNPNNPAWRQKLDTLLAEDRFAEIMDKAIAAMRSRT